MRPPLWRDRVGHSIEDGAMSAPRRFSPAARPSREGRDRGGSRHYGSMARGSQPAHQEVVGWGKTVGSAYAHTMLRGAERVGAQSRYNLARLPKLLAASQRRGPTPGEQGDTKAKTVLLTPLFQGPARHDPEIREPGE